MKSQDFTGGITAVDTTRVRAILPLKGEHNLLSTNTAQGK